MKIFFDLRHPRKAIQFFGVIVCGLILTACSSPKKTAPVRDYSSGRKVESSESAKTSAVKTNKATVKADPIKEPSKEGSTSAKTEAKTEPKSEEVKTEIKKDNTVPDSNLKLSRPATGQTIGSFDGNTNKGIDISGKVGDPIFAAADGKVVYAGNSLRGYGNLVIVKHDNTYLTAYAHNKNLLVKEGESVKRGQKIAEMGNTEADRVKLHFELRRHGKPIDPSNYLQ